jgi:ADP-ribosylglycohydrolase
MDSELMKAYGCLLGVAIGDAMGSPTTFMTPKEIRERYGLVRGFIEPPKDHPIHAGFKAGQVTDDTEMTLLLADSIIRCGRIEVECYVKCLLEWAQERNILQTEYLGPSTRNALTRILHGISFKEAGKFGSTNGAAMKISPIGIVDRRNLDKTIRDVYKICLPTHGTNVAISAAAAVACAISSAFDENSDTEKIINAALYGARKGERLGFRYPSASVEKRIQLALELVNRAGNVEKACIMLYEYIGMGIAANESIPSAIAIVKIADGDPFDAITLAVNCGGDSDTIASIAGAICGALHGAKVFPTSLVKIVEEVNNIKLKEVAEKLLNIRDE